jgi:hypothetical protein
MANKGKCFIVMPITTPEPLLEVYRDGEDHFKHVLTCLLGPAVEKAGYTPLPPEAKGSDLIHAEIIKNLETAEIVLCDMSSLNPNVFFELGIRTSLNKPVCIVKDDLTTEVPFDASIIHYHQYTSSIEPWELPKEIENIANHILESTKRSNDTNEMWKYLGLRSEAQAYKSENADTAKMDYMMLKIDALSNNLESLSNRVGFKGIRTPDMGPRTQESVNDFIINNFPKSALLQSITSNPPSNEVNIHHRGVIDDNIKMGMTKFISNHYAIKLNFINDQV